jgi:hypothetical protein
MRYQAAPRAERTLITAREFIIMNWGDVWQEVKAPGKDLIGRFLRAFTALPSLYRLDCHFF